MNKMKGRRLGVNILSGGNSNPTNNYMYVNDEVTPHNKRLLWMTKTEAKECGWKYVWVRNGHIYARQNENSSAILINNTADIEAINGII